MKIHDKKTKPNALIELSFDEVNELIEELVMFDEMETDWDPELSHKILNVLEQWVKAHV